MEQARPYLKAAAVVSTVTLVGAFVAYRAGAFQPFGKPDAQPAAEFTSPNATSQSPITPPATQLTAENKEPTFLPGSKSLGPLGVGRTRARTPALLETQP